jgi:isopentenyl-diphosphate delta-isomerase
MPKEQRLFDHNAISGIRSAVFKTFMNHTKEMLLLVDEADRYLGEGEKEDCHRDGGRLHRAFLAVLSTKGGELLEARRSGKKRLWPHFWDGTVAGHFHSGERPEESVRKRILEEIGTKCRDLEFLFKFRYRAAFKNVGSENEVCHVFRAEDLSAREIAINPDEVSEYRLSSIPSLKDRLGASPEEFTPWFLIAIKELLKIS